MFKLRVPGASLGRRAIGQMNQQLAVGKAGPLDILVKGVGCQAPEAVQFDQRVVFKAATDGRVVGEPVDGPLVLGVKAVPEPLGGTLSGSGAAQFGINEVLEDDSEVRLCARRQRRFPDLVAELTRSALDRGNEAGAECALVVDARRVPRIRRIGRRDRQVHSYRYSIYYYI